MGTDNFSPKLLKIASNVIDSHIASILNHDVLNKRFSEKAETANYKKDGREELKNYRSV